MLWLIWCVLFGSLRLGSTYSAVLQNETEFDLAEGHRQGRLFPFYTIGRIANVPCLASNGLKGTCLIRGECADNQGIFGGSCSTLTTQATCCIFSRTCGGSTNLNSTYFTNPGYPGSYNGGGTCTFTITPCSSSVCQLRIDFRSLNLAQPNGEGNCLTDVLTITGGSSEVPSICGENTGQHVYINFSELNPITIRVSTTAGSLVDRMWNLQLSQISCASEFRAPEGCLQYYLEPSGVISSFNYGFGANPNLNSLGATGTRQIAGQRYGICIRAAPDRCTITYSLPSTDGSYAFTVSGDAEVLDPTLIGMGVFGENGDICTTDYVVIPSPVVTDVNAAGAVFTDRFCGLGLFSVTSQVKPFVVYVVWDDNEIPDVANRGFRLAYSQNACTLGA
ncbi:AAEL005668-PA [Aedes aegypti]|nr:AAEL005668-PA [Aedes aegypti]